MTQADSLAPRLLPLGDTAWTVEFGDQIDPLLHARVLGLASALAQRRADRGDSGDSGDSVDSANTAFAGIVDVVPTFRSLSVHYNPLVCDGEVLGQALLELAKNAGSAQAEGRCWRLPVCFDEEFAPDMNDLAAAKGLRREAVIDLLCEATFQVYMIGFMPGFPYMGGLPSVLEMPRLASPRKAVPARSLAVAGAMCAVYPWESPGGWRLLGRTPVPMFAASETAAPALLASGDRVRWHPVARAQFDAMEARALAGGLDRRSLLDAREAV
jgi:inhibitor of KinA